MINIVSEMKLGQTTINKKYYLTYLRKSSESEDRQVQSIEDQRNEILPLANTKHLEILEQFEESKSAKAPGRQEFDRMAQLIKDRGDIKGIICWKLNRLSRNPVDTGALQWLLQTGAIDEIVTTSKTYTEVDSDFIMAVEGAQANRFIRDLREDTWRGLKSKIEKGIAPVLAVPGYKNDKTKNQGERDIIVDQVQFPLMRKLFDMALTGNHSISQLQEIANDMGIRNSRSKPISRSRMSDILRDIFYIGKFIYGGKVYDGIHKPMLTIDEFNLLQEIFTNPSRPRTSKHEHPYPSGMIRCICGRSLIVDPKFKTYKNGKTQAFIYLRCDRHHYHPSPDCPRSAINVKDLNKQIMEQLGSIRISPSLIEWGIKRLNEKNSDKRQIRDAQHLANQDNYNTVVKKLENLLQLKLSPDNLVSDGEYVEQRVKLLAERDKLHSQLENLNGNREEWSDLAVAVFNFASRAQERFESGDWETKRNICHIFGTSLVLNDKKLEVQPRTPFVFIQDAIKKLEPRKIPVTSPDLLLYAPNPTFGVEDGCCPRDLQVHNLALYC